MLYPCAEAMVKNVTTIKPDQTIEEALKIFKEKNIRNVPVVDANGKFLGLLGLKEILLNLLPKSVTMEYGLNNLDFVTDAAPGIAKRLKKLHPIKVSEIMNKEPQVVGEDTSTIEALRIIAMEGSPAVVVDEKTMAFKGVISRKTLLDELYGLMIEIEKSAENDDD